MSQITAKRLREVLEYHADTGLFVWKVKTGKKPVIGAVAGSRHSSGYVTIRIDGRRYYAHRLAWLYVHGSWPLKEIDHINGVRDDNRASNIRLATRKQNMENRHHPVGASGMRGVCWLEANQKWRANIVHNRKNIYLGLFPTAEEASRAYQEAAALFHSHNQTGLE